MMKKIASLLFLTIFASSCAYLGGGEADARWADYKSWSKIHSKPITGDHTGFLNGLHKAKKGVRVVYVNNVGLETATGTAPYKYPLGTVILKEQYSSQAAYDAGKKPGVTVMVKVSENAANPAENWAWARGYTRKAKVDDGFCAGCHTIALGSDFSFSNADSLKDFL